MRLFPKGNFSHENGTIKQIKQLLKKQRPS